MPAAHPPSQTAPATWSAAEVPEAASVLVDARLPRWLADLLARRGVADEAAARRFLNPSLDQLHDPLRLAGVGAAVERLVAAREAGETVAVVGDYDVDGVTATALLTAVLGACRISSRAILPHRLREGYGFQPVHVERAVEEGCSVVVTVDCGVSSGEAVRAASAAGVDVILTDHHLPGDGLPAGTLLVNPNQEGCDYPFPGLAGVGLALKLSLAVADACGRRLDPHQLLRIACLGTIADLAPLVDENRVIAALGLRALEGTTSLGLQALFRLAGVKPPMSASDVGFRIGPRLNAAGRLDDAAGALELLTSRDPERCEELAGRLDQLNRERQGEERRVVEEARRMLVERGSGEESSGGNGADGSGAGASEMGDELPPILIAWSADWHPGVLGIAAGRLAREFHRPTVLLALRDTADGEAGAGGDERTAPSATGSGRSIQGVALHDFLDRWRGELARFGGHDQAVGLTVEAATDSGEDTAADSAAEALEAKLRALRDAWETAAAEWPAELLERRYEYELEVGPARITSGFVRQLARLEPHGQGNPQPLARVGPLSLAKPPRIFGKETKHLSAVAVGEDGGRVDLVAWRWGDQPERLAGRFEVLGYIEEDDYRKAPVVRVVDARPL